jgi:spermidine synthase
VRLAAALSFVCGFASLSQEILWVRLYGFTNGSTPAAFGFVLCLYLLGIALGAALGARACRGARSADQLWRASIVALLASGALSPLLAGAFAAAAGAGIRHALVDIVLIGGTSALLSFVFPIAHHLGTERSGAARGRHFARVYTANVAGAALGPLVTGYVLLDAITLQWSFLSLGALQVVAALTFQLALQPDRRARRVVGAAAAASAGAMALAAANLDPHGLLRHPKVLDRQATRIIENRHGVVAIFPGGAGGDVVLGGNVYDGRTNLDPERNTNALQRPLLAAVLHPAPRRVLVPGLSIGTWLAIVREFPAVEAIDVVEINPGYLEAIRDYPAQAAAVRDPRVRLVIDDARRWLRANPGAQYDLILMNTTVHWRANASLLLSRDLLEQLKAHMAPGAILAFNATGSGDALFTAAQVFAHAYRYDSFVYASDTDFRAQKDSERARRVYRELRLQDKPFFAAGSRKIDDFLAIPFVDVQAEQRLRGRPLETVTDENMLTEFRHGRPLYPWMKALAP